MNTNQYYAKAFGNNDYTAESLFYQGICYSYGYGVERDLEKALDAYRRGADLGCSKCKYGLAVLLEKKGGVDGATEAHSLFVEAFPSLHEEATNGEPESQRMISCYYLFGNRGIPKDIDKARKWLEESANRGCIEAQLNLAHCYEKGFGYEKDLNSAKKWYASAWKQGSMKGKAKLDFLGGQDEQESFSG